MENTGFIIIPRQLFNSNLWQEEQRYNTQSAWLDLLTHAHYGNKPGYMRVGQKRVPVGRGQLAFSLRYLAQRWGWKLNRVRRLLQRLEKDGEIVLTTTSRYTLLTFTDYAQRYQLLADAPGEQPETQRRRRTAPPPGDTPESTKRHTGTAQGTNTPKRLETRLEQPATNNPGNTHHDTPDDTPAGTKKNYKVKERKFSKEKKFSSSRKKEREADEKKRNFSFLMFWKAPTAERVAEYCREAGLTRVRPQHFVSYYQARGWHMGQWPMRSWKAAARLWNEREASYGNPYDEHHQTHNHQTHNHEHDFYPVPLGGGNEQAAILRTATAAAQSVQRSSVLRTWRLAGLAR